MYDNDAASAKYDMNDRRYISTLVIENERNLNLSMLFF